MTSGIILEIRLWFYEYNQKQTAVLLDFHQVAANQLRGKHISWTAEEGLGMNGEKVVDRAMARVVNQIFRKKGLP